MVTFNHQNIVFKHMVALSNFECVFCSTEVVSTGRTALYLIFKQSGKIFSRNGLRNTWDEVVEEDAYNNVRQRFDQAILERKIPCYATTLSEVNL